MPDRGAVWYLASPSVNGSLPFASLKQALSDEGFFLGRREHSAVDGKGCRRSTFGFRPLIRFVSPVCFPIWNS